MFAGFFVFVKAPKLTFKLKEKVSESLSKRPSKIYSPKRPNPLFFKMFEK